jgi:hypothetical protein
MKRLFFILSISLTSLVYSQSEIKPVCDLPLPCHQVGIDGVKSDTVTVVSDSITKPQFIIKRSLVRREFIIGKTGSKKPVPTLYKD